MESAGSESVGVAEPSGGSRWGVLRHAHFRTVWIAAFGSYLGTWFEFVGTQWIITERTGSMVWASYLGAAQLMPTLVLGLLGGVVADRSDRKKLLIVTQVAMMLIAVGFAVVVWRDPPKNVLLGSLLVLALAQGVAIAFNNPAWQVLTPRLVPREELVRAITLQGISFNVARAVGPALAGVIMAAWSPTALFAVNALSFIGVLAAVMTTPPAPAPPGNERWWRGVWDDSKAAGRYVFTRRGPRAALLACVVFAVFATPVLRFLSLFVTEVYHREERTFGILVGVMGAGAVAGGLLMKIVPAWYPRHHFIPLSVLLGGLSILAFAVATSVWPACVAMFFVGWFWMWAFNSSMSALQLLVDDSMRGRVMAVCNVVALGLMPLGYFFASAVGEGAAAAVTAGLPGWWDGGLATQVGVGVCAVILIVAGLVMVTYRTPEVDGLEQGQPGYDRKPGLIRGLTASAHRPKRLRRCEGCDYEVGSGPDVSGAMVCPECGGARAGEGAGGARA